jgi:hypothetical protein
MFGLTPWGLVAWVICIVALTFLFVLVVLIWTHWLSETIPYKCFHGFQGVATVLAIIYAIWCAYRLILNVVIPPTR